MDRWPTNKNIGRNESSDSADLGSLISHSISGKEIQEIYHDQNTLINTERIPLASFQNFENFETLQLITNPNSGSDDHSCICVMYKPRKVHKSKVTLMVLFASRARADGRPKNFRPNLELLSRLGERLLWTLQSPTLIALLIFLFIIWIVGVNLILQKLKHFKTSRTFED